MGRFTVAAKEVGWKSGWEAISGFYKPVWGATGGSSS